jgi:hypothetical protein
MQGDRDRIEALIAHLEEFPARSDRRRNEVPIEVGADRRWSAGDTERLFARLGRPVPEAPRRAAHERRPGRGRAAAKRARGAA